MGPIVLFDGVCNFCNSAVNFIIKHDRQGRFRFAPLQSAKGIGFINQHRIPHGVDSVVLIENGQAYTHSDAAIRIASGLGGVFRLAGILRILPQGVRDYLYSQFAARRYSLFGSRDECMIPTSDVRARFLD